MSPDDPRFGKTWTNMTSDGVHQVTQMEDEGLQVAFVEERENGYSIQTNWVAGH